MKKSILFLFVLIPFLSWSKVADTIAYVYCDVMTISNFSDRYWNTGNVDIYIDFGGGKVFDKDHPLTDSGGKIVELKSTVDVLEYLEGISWRLQTSTSVLYGGRIINHHLFKRPKFGQ
jgi:hypothetical protein